MLVNQIIQPGLELAQLPADQALAFGFLKGVDPLLLPIHGDESTGDQLVEVGLPVFWKNQAEQ